MKYLKTYEQLGHDFVDVVLDQLTFVLDDVKHEVNGNMIKLINPSEENIEDINYFMGQIKDRFNFISTKYINDWYILEVKQEWIDFVHGILSKIKPKVDDEKYPNVVFYFIEDQFYIEQDLKTRTFWCRYKDFWSFFESKFNLEHEETQVFLNYLLEEHFKCKDYKTKHLLDE